MFTKLLIANRGEIALRILRTCRQMGIYTVTLYDAADRDSLHVRLADEAIHLDSPADFVEIPKMIRLAQENGVDAIHPGYGFLAERADFARACRDAGLVFVGPSPELLDELSCKVPVLQKVREAGIPTVEFSPHVFQPGDEDDLREEAARMGFPVVIKSCAGGRGRGARFVRTPAGLPEAVRWAQREARTVYGDQSLYLEKAIEDVHQINVPILADNQGTLLHLGEREGSLQYSNRKVLEESPSPHLTNTVFSQTNRAILWQTALAVARLFGLQNAGAVEFLVDQTGNFYFSEIKARLHTEHPLTEMCTGVDIVREQIRLAAGEPLALKQADVLPKGWAMLARVRAVDPWQDFLPSPGRLTQTRLPDGMGVRVDTYIYPGCNVPGDYDPLIAKICVWGDDRAECLGRLSVALEEMKLSGIPTNLPLIQRVARTEAFRDGLYTTSFLDDPLPNGIEYRTLRDMAATAALLYVRRRQTFTPSTPARLESGWHKHSRRLPE
ncbi:MAG: ATP-grasp domain-containing protein [Anaerolineales bacterium]|nr:ATP-grasp domain-containing protein [Anaerolineales bacterium]